jgi:hypothetical protein
VFSEKPTCQQESSNHELCQLTDDAKGVDVSSWGQVAAAQHLWCLVGDGASTGSAAVALAGPEALAEAKVADLGAEAALWHMRRIVHHLLLMLQGSDSARWVIYAGRQLRTAGCTCVAEAVNWRTISILHPTVAFPGQCLEQPLHLRLALLLHLLVLPCL